MQIRFNNILQNLDDFDGTDGLSFVFRKKTESGDSGNSFSPELTVTGAAFDYIYSEIINKPQPQLEEILVDVYDDCCQLPIFTGKIRGADVQYCFIPNCEATVTIVDNSQDALAVTCLKNHFIWDRVQKADGSGLSLGEDTFRPARLLDYCIDGRPSFWQEIILILGVIAKFVIAPLLFIVAGVITTINAIIATVGGDPIGGNINFFDDAIGFIDILNSIITGCGYKHKAPFVHSYLRNLCDICGLSLSSTLFEPSGAYHNTVRLDAAYKPGQLTNTRTLQAYEFNKPNLNGLQFLEGFKEFNIEWRITNGVLFLERKDTLGSGVWIDTATLPEDDILSLCFDVLDDLPPAFAEYQYAKDGVDNTGDETNPDWTDNAIDWNAPPNPAQVGLYSVRLNYSTAQFRQDAGRDTVSALDKPFYWSFYPILGQNRDVMLMEKGICGFPRLLQWDGQSHQNSARVRRFASQSSGLFDYNVDWHVKTAYVDGTGTARDTAYQRLFFIDDPRTVGIKKRRYNLSITADCTRVAGIDLDKVVLISGVGSGTVEEVEWNVKDNILRITGKI
jgi:hypothetical protein